LSSCAKYTRQTAPTRRRIPVIQSGRSDGRDQRKISSGAPPALRNPQRELCKNGGGMWPQCGARLRQEPGSSPAPRVARFVAARPGGVCAATLESQGRPERFTNRNLIRKPVLTRERAEAYIGPLDATPTPWRDAAFLKPLTVHTVNHPASHVAMSDVRASTALLYSRDLY
jgi:hypothetical protein